MTKLKKFGGGDRGVGDEKLAGRVSAFGADRLTASPANVERIEGRGRTLEGRGEEGLKLLPGEGPIPAPPLSGGRDLDIHDLLSMFTAVVCLSFTCVFNAPSDP